ncbi:MAG TPA: LicD family protein [Spirochaetales bacterium]|nr:LicD family protein [Spirochaetales bacterium]HRY53135.1 LicD family protein [Spirochaetia bacterium]HRZ66001.1 LicD family protein [Spirochaetia bacterium]
MQKPIIKDPRAALENMVIARDVLEAAGVAVFLNFGTLLGALREKGFIPHDDDVDMEIYERDEAAFLGCRAELEARGFSFVEKIEQMRLYTFRRNGEQIDFFVARERRTILGRRWDLEGRSTVPARHLDSLEPLDFLGQRFMVPADPYGLVRNLYGSTWKVPIANRPSRIGWGFRLRKLLRHPGRLFFYAGRFLARRARWLGLALRAGGSPKP